MYESDDEFLRLLAGRGVTIDPDGRWVRLPGFAGENRLSDEELRFFSQSSKRYELNAYLDTRWAIGLSEIVDVLDKHGGAAPWAFISLFWVRLHGVLSDIREGRTEFHRTLGIDPATHVPGRSSADFSVAALLAIEAMRSKFSDDELIYAEYRRHSESHPRQDAFELRWQGKSKKTLIDELSIKAVGRTFSFAEMNAAMGRVMRPYHFDEGAIAVAYARRIRPLLPALVEALHLGTPETVKWALRRATYP